jgi:hypothetical protein
MVGACFAPILIPGLPELQWNWPLPGTVELGAILIALPGAALVALLAPLVSYRRRDALNVIFFPPAGIRFAWIIGTRLAQLPHRNWPAREDAIPLQGRHYAWIALAANRYALWRQRRAERGPVSGRLRPGIFSGIVAGEVSIRRSHFVAGVGAGQRPAPDDGQE